MDFLDAKAGSAAITAATAVVLEKSRNDDGVPLLSYR